MLARHEQRWQAWPAAVLPQIPAVVVRRLPMVVGGYGRVERNAFRSGGWVSCWVVGGTKSACLKKNANIALAAPRM